MTEARSERRIADARAVADHAALAMLAEMWTAQRRTRDAAQAILAHPDDVRLKERFIEQAGGRPVIAFDATIEAALVECLQAAKQLDCAKMNVLWTTHLFRTPAFHAAYGLRRKENFSAANKETFQSLSDFTPLFTRCFLLGVRHIVSDQPVFEEFITHVRRHLLEDYGVGAKFTHERSVTLAAALSHYAFNTEYILDGTEEEDEKVQAMCAAVERDGGTERDAAAVAIVACYVPLHRLKNAAAIAEGMAASPELGDVVKKQIADHEARRRIAASIVALTPIEDPVSAKVQEQYEEFPYPRWTSFSPASVQSRWKTGARNEEIEGPLRGRKVQILNAGCGTGRETLHYATILPEADILAVDLSRSSLAYAISKAAEHGIENVTFRQADILRLDALDRQFDYIVSAGMLNAVRDPVEGWRVLTRLLKPGGLMKIGLYSKIARRAIIQAQDVRKQHGYGTDAESMKAFRRNSPRLLPRAVLDELVRCGDYFFLSMYRDLLFHVQEHNFDLLDIEGMLRELGLEFAGFAISSDQMSAYRARYPDDPDGVDLGHWHQFEQREPTWFQSLYLFWCRKEAAR